LSKIKALDPTFDEKQFLQGARAAFTTIIEDFAKGDLSRSARFWAASGAGLSRCHHGRGAMRGR